MVSVIFYSPVLLSSEHAHIRATCYHTSPENQKPAAREPGEGVGDRVLQPMKWGLVPSWRRPDQKNTLLNNCRIEGITEKPSFRSAMERRRRCVVLADG